MEFRKFLVLKPENFHPPSGAKIRKLIGKMAETHTNSLFDFRRSKNEAEAFFEEDEEEFQPDEENEEDSEKADLDDWMDDDELQGFGTEEL
ncbi:hypothetical protein GCK72_013057 [Caenorhabditis remanei]|uniref:Uncharacterized protein n=1 Tax=Caenorhabditis remanei TaxID=31234 RepID=A0A6A5GPM6_CAERE|nr:hypothetical protein GCK72_013057 [Caenorhabditis remanei]KAF1756604.1 hypothetical protein GCK72_013057 [Caenorhabditis remanei]